MVTIAAASRRSLDVPRSVVSVLGRVSDGPKRPPHEPEPPLLVGVAQVVYLVAELGVEILVGGAVGGLERVTARRDGIAVTPLGHIANRLLEVVLRSDRFYRLPADCGHLEKETLGVAPMPEYFDPLRCLDLILKRTPEGLNGGSRRSWVVGRRPDDHPLQLGDAA